MVQTLMISLLLLASTYILIPAQAQSCQPGQFFNHSMCQDCPQGSYTSWINSQDCIPCSYGRYAPGVASETCLDCPEWKAAIHCPEGSSSLVVSDGYKFDDPQITQCIPIQACSDSQCSEGYSGDNCESCEAGYWRWNQQCFVCPSQNVQIFRVVLFCIFLYVMAFKGFQRSKPHKGLPNMWYIAIINLQLIALFPQLQVDWTSSEFTMFKILSIFNVTTEVISPECLGLSELSYWYRWLIRILTPFAFALAFVIPSSLVRLLVLKCRKTSVCLGIRRRLGCCLQKKRKNPDDRKNMRANSIRDLAKAIDIHARHSYSENSHKDDDSTRYDEETKNMQDSYLNRYVYFVLSGYTFFYTNLVSVGLEPFQCFEVYDSESGDVYYLMHKNTSVRCYETNWLIGLWLVILMVLFLLSVPPLFLRAHMEYRHTKIYLFRYYFLVKPYAPSYFYWEVIIFLKRFAVVASFSFGKLDSGNQIFLTTSVYLFFMYFESTRRPYRSPLDNSSSLMWSVYSIFLLISSVNLEVEENVKTIISSALIVILIVLLLKSLFVEEFRTWLSGHKIFGKVFCCFSQKAYKKDAILTNGTNEDDVEMSPIIVDHGEDSDIWEEVNKYIDTIFDPFPGAFRDELSSAMKREEYKSAKQWLQHLLAMGVDLKDEIVEVKENPVFSYLAGPINLESSGSSSEDEDFNPEYYDEDGYYIGPQDGSEGSESKESHMGDRDKSAGGKDLEFTDRMEKDLEELGWRVIWSEAHNRNYFWNKDTNEVHWTLPQDLQDLLALS